MHSHLFAKKRVAAAVSVALGVAGAAPVVAQQSASGDEPVIEEVIVTGIRSSLMRAMDTKRDSQGVVDAITAEDIGDFPDTNLAESLQRITGVSIDRERGEGTTVTVRGFGADFNLVTLNGRQMPTYDGKGRSFNFLDIASEGVAGVDVYKTSRANVHSGGVGATINIKTTKPLEQPGLKAGGSVKGVHDQSTYGGNDYTPELSGFYSQTFLDDTVGVALSGSFQERHSGEAYATSEWSETALGALSDDMTPVPTGSNDGPHVNLPDASDVVGMPRQVVYQLDEFERTRVNGQLTLQWKPMESLTATLDYTVNEFELDRRWNNMSVWFERTGQSGTWTEGSIVYPVIYTERLVNPDRPMGAGVDAFKHSRESTGLNLAWNVTDRLRLALDYHDSSAEREPNSPYGSSATLGIAQFGRQSASVDFTTDIPLATLVMRDTLSPDDMRIVGSVFTSDWGEMDMEQTHLSGTFDLTDTITFDFGIVTTELDSFDGQTVVQRNSWGSSDASAYGTLTDLVRPASLKGIFDELSGGDRINHNFFLFDMEAVVKRADELQRLPADNPRHLASSSTDGDCGTGLCADSNSRSDPSRYSLHEEETLSLYFQASYEGDLMDRPFNLRAGLRYEETDVKASAEAANYSSIVWGSLNEFTVMPATGGNILSGLEGDYDYILPNIDFDIEIWDDLIFRASYSETISRARFEDLKGNLSIGGGILRVARGVHSNNTGTVGNPGLKPHESENFDLSLEWYYSEDSYVSLGYFDKEVVNFVTQSEEANRVLYPGLAHPALGPVYRDAVAALGQAASNGAIRDWIFQNRADAPGVNATNVEVNGMPPMSITGVSGRDDPAFFTVETRINSDEDASVDGWELAWQHTLWDSGFGFIANVTLADGSATFENGVSGPQFALPGLSDTRNLIAFYDKRGLQARLAYNWRDSHFTGGTTVPAYREEYEQWDISISYDLGDIVSTWEGFGGMGGLVVFMEGINITDETYRSHARFSNQVARVGQTGPRYNFGFRYTY